MSAVIDAVSESGEIAPFDAAAAAQQVEARASVAASVAAYSGAEKGAEALAEALAEVLGAAPAPSPAAAPRSAAGKALAVAAAAAAWPGAAAALAEPRAHAAAPGAVPGQLLGHGACRRGRRRCHTGYTGPGCERAAPLCPTACSGHGRCDTAGVCHCHKGYSGEACDVVDVSACPFGCSAHGSCSVEFSNGCECRDGTAPPDCAVVRAPHAADNGPLRLLVHGVGYASIAARAATAAGGQVGRAARRRRVGCPMGAAAKASA